MMREKHHPTHNIHHRRPKAQNGGDDPKNISWVRVERHDAWTLLFPGNLTPHDIARIINDKWLDPDFEFVVRRKSPYMGNQV